MPLKTCALNIRGLNGESGVTKRQVITKVMKDEGLGILLLTEAQVISSSVEAHDVYSSCFSSGTQPWKSYRECAGVIMRARFRPYLYEINI